MVQFKTKDGKIVKFKAKGEKVRKIRRSVSMPRRRRYLPAVRRPRSYPRVRRYGHKALGVLQKTGGVSMWLAHLNFFLNVNGFKRIQNVAQNPNLEQVQGQLGDALKDVKTNMGSIAAGYAAAVAIKVIKRIFKPKGLGWL